MLNLSIVKLKIILKKIKRQDGLPLCYLWLFCLFSIFNRKFEAADLARIMIVFVF